MTEELRRWGFWCDKRNEPIFLEAYQPVRSAAVSAQPLDHPQFEGKVTVQCQGHTHEFTRADLRWLRDDSAELKKTT